MIEGVPRHHNEVQLLLLQPILFVSVLAVPVNHPSSNHRDDVMTMLENDDRLSDILINVSHVEITGNTVFSTQELQQIAGQTGTLLPEEAIQKGLVDELVYFDEVVANLKQETGNRIQALLLEAIQNPTPPAKQSKQQ